jgi:hypothetical protein
MRDYSNPIQVSYRFAAAVLTSAAVVGRIAGPTGRAGRVTALVGIVTTDTDAASTVTVDTNAGVTTPVSAAVGNAPGQNTAFSATKASVDAQSELPADTVVEVQVSGEPTAGAADIVVGIDWY